MPIPQPQPGQSQDQYVYGVCVPFLVSEGYSREQAVAICIERYGGKQKAYQPAKWVTVNRQRGQFRKKYKKEMTNALDRLVKPFFDEIKPGMEGVQLIIMADTIIKPEPIQKIYERMIPEIGLWFAKKEYGKAKKALGNELVIKSPVTGLTAKQSDEEEILEDIWLAEFMEFTRTELGQNIISITGDSKKLLRNYLEKILNENPGLGSAAQTTALTDKLKGRWKSDRFWRAKRIVRTETTTASSIGNQAGINATGKNYIREWSAAFSNTRDDHIEANGQRANKGEAYTGVVEGMMHPGDPAGGAANVVNCMCTESFELIRS
ncbi:MAG: hypothetical protein R6U65_00960 [Perlabentimonas sp.]